MSEGHFNDALLVLIKLLETYFSVRLKHAAYNP